MRKKRIILANAAINSGNKGCAALCYTAMYFIDKVLSDNHVDYELFLTNSGHPDKGSYTIQIGKKSIKYQTAEYPLGFDIKRNIKKIVYFPNTIKALSLFKDTDYILDIGQGDSFSDIYGEYRFKDIDCAHWHARLFKIPYCLLPQTIGPFNNPKIELVANNSIAKAKIVLTRDRMSYDYVKRHVPTQKRVEECIDVAFYLPYEHKVFDRDYIHVGVNVNALLWNGGYTGKNELGLKDDYQKIIRDIIDYFLTVDNVKLHLVPHVVSDKRVLENDYSVATDLLNRYNNSNLIISPFFVSPVDAKSYISGMDFFMGARMHSTIAAFSSGVPVVPMAYSRKFNGLFGDTLNYKYFTDLKEEDSQTILNKVKECFDNRKELAKTIQSQQNLIKERGERILANLNEFLNL